MTIHNKEDVFSKLEASCRPLRDEELEQVAGGAQHYSPPAIVVTAPEDQPWYSGYSPTSGIGLQYTLQALAQAAANGYDAHEALAQLLEDNPIEDLWIDADGDGLHDITGEGQPIIVTGDASPYQGVPDGYIRAPGTDLYMYPLGPDGQPDTSGGPELTEEGLEHICETYAQGMEAIDTTMQQSGFVSMFSGILSGGPPGSLPLIGGIAGLTAPPEGAPEHCE